jgi:outer membrane protein OmpA-like peptidoglycan-associated protein
MSALRTLWSDPAFLRAVEGRGEPDGKQPGTAGAETPVAVADQADAGGDPPDLEAEIKAHLAELTGPYKEAVANDGPDAQELKELYGVVQTAVAKGDFAEAAEALSALEELLGQQTNVQALTIPGMDTAQAGPVIDAIIKHGTGPAKWVGKKVWKHFHPDHRQTTIKIENRTSKVLLNLEKEELKNRKHADWVKKAPAELEAAKNGKGTEVTVVVTTKGFRGGKIGDTSGVYWFKVMGEAKDTKVYLEWTRTSGGKKSYRAWVDGGGGRYYADGSQSGADEFTFVVKEDETAKPQSPADANSKDPQTDGGKDSKSPPPADIHVLFDLDSPDLTPMAQSALRRFANAYKAAKSTATITVEGWASIEGPERRNERLSYNRAKAVSDYLSKEEDLPKTSIEWEGKKTTTDFGKDKNDLPPNRRATISLSGGKGSATTPPDTKKEPQSPTDPKAKAPQARDNEEPTLRPRRPHAASRPGV